MQGWIQHGPRERERERERMKAKSKIKYVSASFHHLFFEQLAGGGGGGGWGHPIQEPFQVVFVLPSIG